MSEATTGTALGPQNQTQSYRLNLILFRIIIAASCSIFWLSPHPPMVDIPQHAGQVAIILDLLGNDPKWQDTFYINYFTPYWLGYGLWAILSLIMPIALALKIILSITFLLFIFSGKNLRRSCHADERLDWLLIPSFFGFCFSWGFLTFLMAAPAGMLFIAHTINSNKINTLRHSACIFLSGIFLFFCHGLVFIMCIAIGALIATTQSKSLKGLALRLTPYVALTPLLIVYFLSASTNATTANFTYPLDYLWLFNAERILQFIIFPWGNADSPEIIKQLGIVGLLSPILIGCRLNEKKKYWIPFSFIFLIWIAAPHFAMKTFFLYERFSLFILPFYILLFISPAEIKISSKKNLSLLSRLSPWILPVIVTLFIALTMAKTLSFASESKDFSYISQKIPEGKRVAAIIYDRQSVAIENSVIYTHYASWYQAEKKGIVDFSFSWFSPQPVRFKASRLPSMKPGIEWYPDDLKWETHLDKGYEYYFVRGNISPINIIIKHNPCSMRHLATSGSWHVYKKSSCEKIQADKNDNT